MAQQRVFLILKYAQTQNSAAVIDAFQKRFPQQAPPLASTDLRNFENYDIPGPSLNLNKVDSGRRRVARFDENVDAVRERSFWRTHA